MACYKVLVAENDPVKKIGAGIRFSIVARAVFGLALLACMPVNSGQTPAGVWKIVDERTGQPNALLRIAETGGRIEGKFEKIFFQPGDDPNPRCEKCEGANKNRPLLGMTILWGQQKQGNEYTGRILNPDSGEIYQCKLILDEDGRKLKVHGYVWVPLFGQTQTWLRVE
ncbi:MAG TPA: DUF2147 domain-containing protein [Burkholderiales bacterium]|nr:DUF2147 domain-containing protein [Burkholderiales bacterium]